eukprot:2840892-Pleurochrysis_carterae.AAC.1
MRPAVGGWSSPAVTPIARSDATRRQVSGRSRPPSRRTSSSSASAARPASASRGPTAVEPSRAAHVSPSAANA